MRLTSSLDVTLQDSNSDRILVRAAANKVAQDCQGHASKAHAFLPCALRSLFASINILQEFLRLPLVSLLTVASNGPL